jgi:hypothetical protein
MTLHPFARRVATITALVLGSVTHDARADEWSPPKPKSAGTGAPITLKRSLADAAHLPRGRVVTTQTHNWADKHVETALEFEGVATPGKPDVKGRAQVDLTIELTGLAIEDQDLMPDVREKGAHASVLTAFDAHGYAAEGKPSGGAATGPVAHVLKPAGAWLLPYLPEKPVKVGETWDLPIPYFLWSVSQLGGVPAEGFATQVLEAVQDRAGVRCARIRTVAALRRAQPEGMTPSSVGIGKGPALARFHAEGTMWVDLDGCLREDALDLKMRVENTGTQAWMEWTFHREVKAQPAGSAPAAKDWSKHTGNLKFVVGFEQGMAQAWEAGRPAMLFFTSSKDHWCPLFGTRTWKDKEVLEKVKPYLPVLVDADESPELVKRYDVLLLPAVVWVDSDGHQIFVSAGDAQLEIFRMLVETARKRAPDEPSASFVAVQKAAEAMRAGIKSGDLKAALRAIHEIRQVNRPKAIVDEAAKVEAEISKTGEAALAKAKELLQSGKKSEAKEALQKLRTAYGDHPVGREAWALLRQLQEEESK